MDIKNFPFWPHKSGRINNCNMVGTFPSIIGAEVPSSGEGVFQACAGR
jgi:hypothetical protein